MLRLESIHKTYENQTLLKGISFAVDSGETVCLLGASGSGKSTILRIVAGLEQPDQGDVRWNGQSLAGIPTHQRHFGLMFQDYALFPHLNVFENVAFGLRIQNLPSAEITRQVTQALEMVHLTTFSRRRVAELSGGEQQRVALARALAPRPRLLMLDEPLGALDRALRESLLEELRQILRQTGIPAIYVTHDQEEAFAIADRIILLNHGEIAQTGSPDEVFAKPASAWVASFLGLGNVVTGRWMEGPNQNVALDLSNLKLLAECPHRHQAGDAVTVLIRPQAVRSPSGSVSGKVTDVVFRGDGFRIELEHGLYFHLTEAPRLGELISLLPGRVECL